MCGTLHRDTVTGVLLLHFGQFVAHCTVAPWQGSFCCTLGNVWHTAPWHHDRGPSAALWAMCGTLHSDTLTGVLLLHFGQCVAHCTVTLWQGSFCCTLGNVWHTAQWHCDRGPSAVLWANFEMGFYVLWSDRRYMRQKAGKWVSRAGVRNSVCVSSAWHIAFWYFFCRCGCMSFVVFRWGRPLCFQ